MIRAGYVDTVKVTVFETDFPFFGRTVTVTLQLPDFIPLTEDPDTLQTLDDHFAIFKVIDAPLGTEIFANAAIDFLDIADATFRLVSGVDEPTDPVGDPIDPSDFQSDQFPAPSLTRALNDTAAAL